MKYLPTHIARMLHSTYGFPIELTVEIGEEQGFKVDMDAFKIKLKEEQDRSRAASKFKKQK